jgi:hypothetical protein
MWRDARRGEQLWRVGESGADSEPVPVRTHFINAQASYEVPHVGTNFTQCAKVTRTAIGIDGLLGVYVLTLMCSDSLRPD